MGIVVVPYDERWPEMFELEAARLRVVLGDEVVAIHHIGSTAVPGMIAKPIIDVLVEAENLGRIDGFDDCMEQNGYVPMGEFGIKGRRFFIRSEVEKRIAHVHVFEAGDPHVARHTDFRDYIISSPGDARVYARLKTELTMRYPDDRDAYTKGKEEFIRTATRRSNA
jgi:GrpB-like predicted nucleotidyltransferase (UPF0157 family)